MEIITGPPRKCARLEKYPGKNISLASLPPHGNAHGRLKEEISRLDRSFRRKRAKEKGGE